VQVSLRTRLTVWYSVVLVLTVAVFSASVLWLHWRLLLDQFDDGLKSISVTAGNVVDEELNESRDLRLAAAAMASVVHPPDDVIEVLDGAGTALSRTAGRMPLPAESLPRGATRATHTVDGPNGERWRIHVRSRGAQGQPYVVVVGAPLDEAIEQWHRLLQACLIGIPLALAVAGAGGLWLVRHGLTPLTAMAAEAQAITATTLDTRLTVPASTREFEQIAGSFNHVLDRLGTALSTQRRFMADASHELRTPVSIMRTAAEVTLSQPRRNEAEYREALTTVAQQASRLTRLVDDMLVLARADGGGYPMAFAALDFARLIEQCVGELAARAENRDIDVQTSLEAITLEGDEALLTRMLTNLFGNAIAYTPQGGSVHISLSRVEGCALLRIADTGPGIPLDDRERVFERFVRLDPARGSGGAGLGLAIARWVAEAHGGALRIVSSSPAGTTFTASLPV
jgi:two-component system OmpR family sensor kinase